MWNDIACQYCANNAIKKSCLFRQQTQDKGEGAWVYHTLHRVYRSALHDEAFGRAQLLIASTASMSRMLSRTMRGMVGVNDDLHIGQPLESFTQGHRFACSRHTEKKNGSQLSPTMENSTTNRDYNSRSGNSPSAYLRVKAISPAA